MPVFFLVGGYANAASLTAAPGPGRRRHRLAARPHRPAGPPDHRPAGGAGPRPRRWPACWGVDADPGPHRGLVRHHPALVPRRVPGGGGPDPADATRCTAASGWPCRWCWWAWSPSATWPGCRAGRRWPAGNYLFGWLAIHQLGFAWYDARRRRAAGHAGPDADRTRHPRPTAARRRRAGWPCWLGGLVALVLLTLIGPYPVACSTCPASGWTTPRPPSLALLAVATAATRADPAAARPRRSAGCAGPARGRR